MSTFGGGPASEVNNDDDEGEKNQEGKMSAL